MWFSKTVDNDGYVRIEEDCGAAVTLFIDDEYAEIISLFVPRAERLQGMGTELVKVAEQMALSRGAEILEADFYAEVPGMSELFMKSGFSMSESATICSVDTGKLLAKKEVQDCLKKKYTDAAYYSLEELTMKQWDGLLAILSAFSIRLSSSDLSRYSQSMSGVVYDDMGMVQSFILCSECDNGVHVDLLCSAQKKNDSYMMAAIQGMLMEIYASGGAKRYSEISVLCVDDGVKNFLKSFLSGNPERKGSVLYSKKDLSSGNGDTIDIDEDLDEDMEGEWRREIGQAPYQQNIGWKVLWHRNRQRKESVKKKQEKKPDKTTADEIVTETGSLDEFPLELMDPQDIDYGCEKEEDVTEGLESDSVVRITSENIDDFKDILPVDALQDLPRPMHRGLAFEKGDGISYLIYELKNTDADEETGSEIRWMDFSASGKTLLNEYTNEIKKARVVKSTLETDPENLTVFSMAGFAVEEKECQAISVTVEELTKLSFANKKSPDYVLRLRDVGERKFKRGIGTCMIYNHKGLLDDLAFLPMEWFELDTSSVVITDGKVSGLLLMHQLPSKRLAVDLLFSSGGDAQLDIVRLITHSIQAAAAKYPKDTPVILKRHNKNVRSIADKLFPGKKGKKVLYCEREERK